MTRKNKIGKSKTEDLMKPCVCECECSEFMKDINKEYTAESRSGRLAQLVENLTEHVLLEQADVSKVPVFIRHCVIKIWEKHKGGINPFAVCVAQFQKIGYIEKGSMDKLTAKGEEAVKKHSSEPDAAEKDAKYEKILKQMKRGRKKEKAKTKAKVAAASEKEVADAAMESQEDKMDIRKLAEELRNLAEGKKKDKEKEEDWEDEDEDEEDEMDESLSEQENGNENEGSDSGDDYVEIGEGDAVQAGDGSKGKVVAISEDGSTLDVQWEDGSVVRYDANVIDAGELALV